MPVRRMGLRAARGKKGLGDSTVNGREYFRRLASEQHIDTLNAAEITELPPLGLKQGPSESRLGGRIQRDLKVLTPEETLRQHEKADRLVKRLRRSFPAEETDEKS